MTLLLKVTISLLRISKVVPPQPGFTRADATQIFCNSTEGRYRREWWLFSYRGGSAATGRGCDGYDLSSSCRGTCSNWEGMLWFILPILYWWFAFIETTCVVPHPEIDRTWLTLERRKDQYCRIPYVHRIKMFGAVSCPWMEMKNVRPKLHCETGVEFLSRLILSNQDTRNLIIP